MANPVHSLHLAPTQMEVAASLSNNRFKPPSVLYGEEQQRTDALRSKGIVEYWCPLDGYSTILDDCGQISLDPEVLSSLDAIQKQQQQQQKQELVEISSALTSPPMKKQKLNPDTVSSITTAAMSQDQNQISVVLKGSNTSMITNQDAPSTMELNVNTVSTQTEGNQNLDLDLSAAVDVDSDARSSEPVLVAKNVSLTDVVSQSFVKMDGVGDAICSVSSLIASTEKIDHKSTLVDKKETLDQEEVLSYVKTPIITDLDSRHMVQTNITTKPTSSRDIITPSEINSKGTNSTAKDVEREHQLVADKDEARLGEESSGRNPRDVQVPNEVKQEDNDTMKGGEVKGERMDQGFILGQKAQTSGENNDERNDGMGIYEAAANTGEVLPVKPNCAEQLSDDKMKEGSICDEVPVPEPSTLEAAAPLGNVSNLQLRDAEADPPKGGAETLVTTLAYDKGSGVSDQEQLRGIDIAVMPAVVSSSLTGESLRPKESWTTQGHETNSELNSSILAHLKTEGVKAGGKVGFSIEEPNRIQSAADAAAVEEIASRQNALPIASTSGTIPEAIFGSFHNPKPDPFLQHLRSEEDRICLIRRAISLKRTRKKGESKDSSTTTNKKKRKRDADAFKPSIIPGWRAAPASELSVEQEEGWLNASRQATATVENWMVHYRLSRESYWAGVKHAAETRLPRQPTFYLQQQEPDPWPCCQWCVSGGAERSQRAKPKKSRKERKSFAGDELMLCLECSFVGCATPSLAPSTRQHMLNHLLISGHQFAVSCGEKAQIFCFSCGDFVYHDVFEQEKIRIDCSKKLSYMGWKEHSVLRSFDAFQFLKTQDHGIVWRGLIATYPPIVPKEHFFATQLIMRRQALFEGNAAEDWVLSTSHALQFAAKQRFKHDKEKFSIGAPVGMYNHGNTCYMSAILQCLVICQPLQHYFLKTIGHHHKSCEMYRRDLDKKASMVKPAASPAKSQKVSNPRTAKKATSQICLACEMDRLFLSYYGSTNGTDVLSAIDESMHGLVLDDVNNGFLRSTSHGTVAKRGCPLLISEFITSAWKSGGMDHLAGYEQRDAHEFLNSFLELLSSDIVKFRERIYAAVSCLGEENALAPKPTSADTGKLLHGYYPQCTRKVS
jgi:hypothetical protein